MHDAQQFLSTLAMVLCVAAVTTVVFQRLRQPVVLGYILAGLIVGPNVPIPLLADSNIIRILSETGVILLMFSLGLEFSLRKLVQLGPSTILTAVIETSVMIWLGFTVGHAFGWTQMESVFAGVIIAISSTTIIAKAFEEQDIKGKIHEFAVGILIVEDLIAILLIAALTALSTGHDLTASTIAVSGGKLAFFLVVLVVVGLLIIPRLVRSIIRLQRAETTLVASIGICFAIALLARELGYSAALGAFIAGSLVAESGEKNNIDHLVKPVRDMFVAIFFVSVGMLIKPLNILDHWLEVAIFTLIVILGKVTGVTLGAFFTGNGIRTSVRTGMSLAQIGEFSFIIAALGISSKATGDFLYTIAVAVSALTTLITPWLIRAGDPAARLIDRKLPRPFQTFAALYGSWIESMRSTSQDRTTGMRVRRLAKLLLLDSVLLTVIVIGAAVTMDTTSRLVITWLGLSPMIAQTIIVFIVIGLSLPFMIGIIRIARGLGLTLATIALPEAAQGKVDLADAPRKAFLVMLQLTIILIVGLPLLALTQPFLPQWVAASTLGVLILFLGIMLWRNATNLQGHISAGAELIVEALARQTHRKSAISTQRSIMEIKQLLPGLGELVPISLDDKSFAVGKTLAQLNLRGLTGASVLAIVRGKENVVMPSAGELLRVGDILALVGTREAVNAANFLLRKGQQSSP